MYDNELDYPIGKVGKDSNGNFLKLDKEVHEHPMGDGFAQKDVKHFADGFHEGNWEKD